MKTITLLSIAIATSLATHLVLAHSMGQATAGANTTTSAQNHTGQSAAALGRGHHAGKHLPQAQQADAVAKPQTQTTTSTTQVTTSQTNIDSTLAKIDTNQDGKITQDELKAALADQVMTQFDVNQDGKITQDEVQALRVDEFKKMDTNSDGFLSVEEFQTGVHQYRHDLQSQLPVLPPVRPMGKHGHFAEADSWLGAYKDGKGGHFQTPFNRFDTNGDGKISETEFVANLPVFDKFDCNETGVITKEDLLKDPCQKAQPTTTQPVTTTTTPVTTTTTPVTTTTTTTVPEPTVVTTPTTTTSTTVEETTTTETTVEQPATQSDHSGGAPCSTCHGNN